jgi:hypothetical protein
MQTEADLSESTVRLAAFPNLMKFIGNSQISSEHPVWGLEDGLLKALDFFFSLRELPGIEAQKKKFLCLDRGDGRTNKPETQNASFWAEIRATYLLNTGLGAEILGFEQPSPRGPRKRCDIVAMFEDSRCFFEVKRKSADVRQKIPVLLEIELAALGKEIGFALTPQLRQRDYNCDGLPALVNSIKQYVAAAPRDHRDIPLPFSSDIIEVFFRDDGNPEIWCEYLQPDAPEDIEKYILGRRDGKPELDKSGKLLAPMVEQCRLKGADYLATQIAFMSPREIAQASFPEITQLNQREWATKDWRLSSLSGVLLFGTNMDWCLVRNTLRAAP